MAVVFVTSAVFAALLLSQPGAGADDYVTWRKCKRPGEDYRGRVLEASPDSKATWMVLEHCNLSEVRSGDFDGLPNVQGIFLDSNSIAHVDPAAFRTVPKLLELGLDSNNLREVPVFDEHSFCPSLTTLYLSRNRITEINHPKTFSGCAKLEVLYMSSNVIEYIHPDVFRPLSKLTSLYISNNTIIAIPETLFIKNNKLNYLFMTDNKILYFPIDFASKLRSAGAPLQWFFFHNNPWHCACLLELLADVKRAGVEHVSEYIGRWAECVYDGPYPCCRPARSGLLRRRARPLALANSALYRINISVEIGTWPDFG